MVRKLWEQGESRPTHQPKPIRTRNYRTRLDPFEDDWSTILEWLQKEPDVAAFVKKVLEAKPINVYHTVVVQDVLNQIVERAP